MNDDADFTPMMSQGNPSTGDAPAIGGDRAPWQFYGIADCYGLESFAPAGQLEGRLGILMMRVHANPQRCPVLYAARLVQQDADDIEAMMAAGMYDDALRQLKAVATALGVAGPFRRCWDRIPDPRIDPYYSGE